MGSNQLKGQLPPANTLPTIVHPNPSHSGRGKSPRAVSDPSVVPAASLRFSGISLVTAQGDLSSELTEILIEGTSIDPDDNHSNSDDEGGNGSLNEEEGDPDPREKEKEDPNKPDDDDDDDDRLTRADHNQLRETVTEQTTTFITPDETRETEPDVEVSPYPTEPRLANHDSERNTPARQKFCGGSRPLGGGHHHLT